MIRSLRGRRPLCNKGDQSHDGKLALGHWIQSRHCSSFSSPGHHPHASSVCSVDECFDSTFNPNRDRGFMTFWSWRVKVLAYVLVCDTSSVDRLSLLLLLPIQEITESALCKTSCILEICVSLSPSWYCKAHGQACSQPSSGFLICLSSSGKVMPTLLAVNRTLSSSFIDMPGL